MLIHGPESKGFLCTLKNLTNAIFPVLDVDKALVEFGVVTVPEDSCVNLDFWSSSSGCGSIKSS